MNLFVRNGSIFDSKGKEIKPDTSGIIVVEIDNTPRRFVKEKLATYLEKSGNVVAPPKRPAPPKPKRTLTNKTWTQRNPRKERTDFTRAGTMVKAKKDGKEYGPYLSMSACARELGLVKSTVYKGVNGAKNEEGYEFFLA